MQIFIAFPHIANVCLLRHHPPGPKPRRTYCAPSHRSLPSSPKKHFCFYCAAGSGSTISAPHCIFKPTLTWQAPGFFFSHEYVLITRSLVLLNIVMTFVSHVSLWLEKALAKASLKCISGCAEQYVRSLCWGGVLGHCDRRKKQLSHTAKIIAFAYSSAKA